MTLGARLRTRAGRDVHVLPDLCAWTWACDGWGSSRSPIRAPRSACAPPPSGLADSTRPAGGDHSAPWRSRPQRPCLLAGLVPARARALSLPAGPSLGVAGLRSAGAAHGLLYPALTALVVDVTRRPSAAAAWSGCSWPSSCSSARPGARQGSVTSPIWVGLRPDVRDPERRARRRVRASPSGWSADGPEAYTAARRRLGAS